MCNRILNIRGTEKDETSVEKKWDQRDINSVKLVMRCAKNCLGWNTGALVGRNTIFNSVRVLQRTPEIFSDAGDEIKQVQNRDKLWDSWKSSRYLL